MTNVKQWATEGAAIGAKAVRQAIGEHFRHGRSVWISDNGGGVRKLTAPSKRVQSTSGGTEPPSTTFCGVVQTGEVRTAIYSYDDLFNISTTHENLRGQMPERRMIFEVTICSVGDDLAGIPLRDEEALKASNVAAEFIQSMSSVWLKDEIYTGRENSKIAPSKGHVRKLLTIIRKRKSRAGALREFSPMPLGTPDKIKKLVLKRLSNSRLAWVEGMTSAEVEAKPVSLGGVAESGISQREIANHLLLGHSLWLCGNDRTCVQIRKGSDKAVAQGAR